MKRFSMRKFVGTVILGSLLLGGCSNNQNEPNQNEENEEATTNYSFEELEKEYDAKLGVYALNTGSNQSVSYREDERFGYASAHKALAVGVLLKNKSIEELDEKINFTEEDLVNYNPVTEEFVDEGMTLKELSDASMRYSDNTAANLILEAIGGPEGFKEVLREIGDDVTEPERIEPDLNDVSPGETNDTSTPKALAESLQSFTLGDVLSEEKQEMLNDWLIRNTTGDNLIRAGVPEDWVVGDRTGSGSYGTRNNIAVIWPPNDDPIILSILSSREEPDADYDDELIAKAAEIAVERLEEK
ncbi:class A beta-lactamase [Salipaludibacillus neizhouensis]|uniref:Class A beta-lactamase n=1 Tax=Salipaludibacillus neizhouensis TaxID=885475 RepID=A0A3A9KJ30_9BACI|nr:class A beta-lactamase [Salipaludibacillus neizhouensis]RKL64896.1 class A beta-lactamase [Salipaludibacillus neizhouensis]